MSERQPAVRIDLVDDELVVASWMVGAFSHPAGEYDANGKTYKVIAYRGPDLDEHGQTFYEVLVHPR